MTPEEANAILAKRFGMKQPVVAQPGMYVKSPQSQPSIFPNSQPQLSKAEQLIKAARERLMNAGGAARMKMREQEEQGVRSYVPADPVSASFEIARKTGESGVPLPRQAVSPTQLQQRPTGGVIASYGPQERVVTSRYGTGTATAPTGKPATFDGKTKAQFFGQAAARQGVDNKYARADKAVLEAIKNGVAKRETGGPVEKGKPYIVGEKGPEVVVPTQDGVVLPNQDNQFLPKRKKPTMLDIFGYTFGKHTDYVPLSSYPIQNKEKPDLSSMPLRHKEDRSGGISKEDLILAVNKFFGTAPAQRKREYNGIWPFDKGTSIVPVMPSEKAMDMARKIIDDAKIPQNLDQASQAEMLSKHMKKIGIVP